MGETRDAWAEVAERFSALGRDVRRGSAERAAGGPADGAPGGGAPGGGAAQDGSGEQGAEGRGDADQGAEATGGGSARGEVGQAVRDVVAAVERAFQGLEERVADPAVREQAKAAVPALRDAVSTTFEDLGSGLRRERSGSDAGDGAAEGGAAEGGAAEGGAAEGGAAGSGGGPAGGAAGVSVDDVDDDAPPPPQGLDDAPEGGPTGPGPGDDL